MTRAPARRGPRTEEAQAKAKSIWQLYDGRPHDVLERVGDRWQLWGRFPNRATATAELQRLAKAIGFDAVKLRRIDPPVPAGESTT